MRPDQSASGCATAAYTTTPPGQPVTAQYVKSNAKLHSINDGRYLLLLGNDAERPVRAFRWTNTEGAAVCARSSRVRRSAGSRFQRPSL